MKVYVTKYALTKGVYIVEGEPSPEAPSYCRIKGFGTLCESEWHRTQREARARVVDMLIAKRRSIRRELVRLDAIDPDEVIQNAKVRGEEEK